MSTYSEQLASASKTVTITPEPLIFDKVGDTFRGMYIGLAPDVKTGETDRVAHFFDGEKIVFNMGMVLVNTCKRLTPGISLEITLKELKPNKKNGKTKIYSVTPLDIPTQDVGNMFGGVLVGPPAAEHLLPAPTVAEPDTANPELDELRAAMWGE